MIKVNLLRDQTAHVRKPAVAVKPEVSRTGLIVLAIMGVTLVSLGSYWYYLDGEIKKFTEQRNTLRAENERLQALKKEVEKFEKLKKLRQMRIETIEKLKDSQTGPVLLLNHVIQSVPRERSLWLTSVDQKGDHVQVVGYAFASETIPDFMTNLSRTGFFNSVDLELMEEEKDATRFSLTCNTKKKKATTE
jgi:Tfp pilus assembly protein PilN